jgi:sigma-B regulation protein RsbU (phosphoserine phosphatase)
MIDEDPAQLNDLAPCGFLSTTPDGAIRTVNRTFVELSGRPADELVGHRTFAQLLSAGGRIYHETHFAPLLRLHGTASGVAFELVRPDGSRLPVLVNAVLQRDEDGQPQLVRLAVFDATERRAYEAELLRTLRRAEESEARATALARTLQQVLIPHEPPVIDGLDLAAGYRPARSGEEIGGDFYDFFQTDDGWVLVVGDVCGKGAEAAVVTALVRHSLRSVVRHSSRLDLALELLNDTVLRHSERFATVVLVHLTREDGGWRATVTTGGHPLPLLRRADGAVEMFGEPGSLVGAVAEATFHTRTTLLGPGDSLLLYTDGVPEGRRGHEFYGEARLMEAFGRPGDAVTVVRRLLDDVLAFQAGVASDDIALVMAAVPKG